MSWYNCHIQWTPLRTSLQGVLLSLKYLTVARKAAIVR